MGDGDAGPGVGTKVDGLVGLTFNDPDIDDVLHGQSSDGSVAAALDAQAIGNSGTFGEVGLGASVNAWAWGPAGCCGLCSVETGEIAQGNSSTWGYWL